MRFAKPIIGILAAVITVQLLGFLLLALIVYQVTPKSILARETFIGEIPGLLAGVRILDRATNIFYWGPRSPEKLPHYALQIDSADLQKIEESLPKSLSSPWYGNIILTEDAKEWVKGTFTADGKEYDVDVRVRGDIFNHWAYRKKSWRVRFDGGVLFNGMREINLIIPEDRGWIAEPFNAYRAKQFGFLQPPMEYVTVSLNGSSPMIYTQIEQWSKELLEKQARPGDVNLYGAGGGTSYFQQWDDVFSDIAYWNKYESAVAPPHDSYEEMEALRLLSLPDAHRQPGYQERVSSLIDPKDFTDWYALSLLSGSMHVRDYNLRFFYDVSRGLLEPIPWDIGLYAPRSLYAPPGNPFLNEVLRVPQWKLQAYETVWAYLQDQTRVEKDLAEASRLRSLVERAAYRDPVKLQSNRQVKHELNGRISQIRDNLEFLKKELSLSEVLVHQRVPAEADRERGLLMTFELTARGVSPARFHQFSLPKNMADAWKRGEIALVRDDGDGLLESSDPRLSLSLRADPDKSGRPVLQVQSDSHSLLWVGDPVVDEHEVVKVVPHTLHRFFLVRRSGGSAFARSDLPLNLDIRNAVTGEKAQVLREVIVDDRTLESLPLAYASRSSFLERYPMFDAGVGNEVILRGSPTFLEDVIVPSAVKLRVEPGTTVLMGSGVTLLSYAPVQIVGSSASRIRFESATSGHWGSLLVVNAKEPSRVEWAEFAGGGETLLNDIYATGMVAFHASPVTIRDSFFRNSHGDDALNIKYIPADLARLHFTDAGADALDIDMAPSGVLEDSTFLISEGNTDSNGDGVDLSWSSVTLRNLTIEGSRDKCISVGESSKPVIEDVTLRRCHFGIASKDGSAPTVQRAKFIGNDIAVTAYVKKPIFGLPTMEIRDSTFEGNTVEQEALNGATITIIR
ncbi:CotH kinase family protein [Candidatus Peregrinibacteria bacterium]|nr:CotH kinase family protein [Candidatus Peregrinibacteria bacterium]